MQTHKQINNGTRLGIATDHNGYLIKMVDLEVSKQFSLCLRLSMTTCMTTINNECLNQVGYQ